MSDPAHPLTEWSARFCVACYLASVIVSLQRRGKRNPVSLWFWSLAAVLLGIHTLLAFHFEHAWSHSAALLHTADQTETVTGLRTGAGLYVNYATLALWLTDVAMQWLVRASSRIRSACHVAAHCICGFIVFNATVVFGPRWWNWIALSLAIILICQNWWRPAASGPRTGNYRAPSD